MNCIIDMALNDYHLSRYQYDEHDVCALEKYIDTMIELRPKHNTELIISKFVLLNGKKKVKKVRFNLPT